MRGTADDFEAGRDIPQRHFLLIATGILVLAAAIRFWDLGGAPIWMDEAFTILVAQLPLDVILFNGIDNHPPLSYALQHLWTRVSDDPALARVPAALCGTATVLAVIGTMADLISRRAALVSGIIIALGTGHIYFSQDARMYPVLVLGLILAVWGLLGGVRAHGRARWGYGTLYLVGGAIAIYAHVIGLVYLAALNGAAVAVLLLTAVYRPALGWWVLVNVLLFVIAIPWLMQILAATGTFPGLGAQSAITANWFFRNAVGFPGAPDPLRKIAEVILILICLGGAALALRPERRLFAAAGLAGLVTFPLLIVLLNFKVPILSNRVFLPSIIAIAMLGGYALATIRPRWVSHAGLAGLICVAAWSSVREIDARTKYEDIPAALAFADDQGFPAAPIVTCHHFTAGSAWIAAPERQGLTRRRDGIIRFDETYFRTAELSMVRLRGMGAAEINSFLGGGYLVQDGFTGIAEQHDKLAAIVAPCPEGFMDRLDADLAPHGYMPVANSAFPGGLDGKTLMRRSETVVRLYQKQ